MSSFLQLKAGKKIFLPMLNKLTLVIWKKRNKTIRKLFTSSSIRFELPVVTLLTVILKSQGHWWDKSGIRYGKQEGNILK